MVEPAPPSGEIVDGEHRLGVRVYYEDTDFTGVVYHANYLRFMERGRSEFLRLTEGETTAENAFAVIRMEIDFLAPARIHDALAVRTRLAEIRGPRLIFRQQVRRGDLVLCRAVVTAAPITAEGRARRPSRNELTRWTILTKTSED